MSHQFFGAFPLLFPCGLFSTFTSFVVVLRHDLTTLLSMCSLFAIALLL